MTDDAHKDPQPPQADRIVDARMRLMARFKDAQSRTPSLADKKPMGAGPTNRHGMPQVPVGQTVTTKWPVLDLGEKPVILREQWRLVVDGAVQTPVTLDWAAFMALPQTEDVSDFHCVTTWSKLDVPWVGVRVSAVLALAEPTAKASHLMIHGADGYTTNVSLVEALKDDVLLVHTALGAPLEREHGGPVRMITPQLYAWKGSKWITRIEVLTADRLGFWEERGYSATAHPWRNDRYS